MENQIVKPIIFESYLAAIKNSAGSNLFRNFYAEVDGTKQDIMSNGDLSCAFFASSVLLIFGLIKKMHGTVLGTVKDLKDSGWTKDKEPKIGSVIVWEAELDKDGNTHRHIGFYMGDGKAISNDSKSGTPKEHDWEFGGKRKVEAIYWKQI